MLNVISVKKNIKFEFLNKKHCKKVQPKVLNPKCEEIIDPDTEKIENS